jgi:tRNA (uracil-5-)-methyltransferase
MDTNTPTSLSSTTDHSSIAVNSNHAIGSGGHDTTAGHEIVQTHSLVVNGWDRYGKENAFMKFLDELGVVCWRAKKVPQRDMCFVDFRTHDELMVAMPILQKVTYKGRCLQVFEKTGKRKDRDDGRERNREGDSNNKGNKKHRGIKNNDFNDRSSIRTAKDATAPWHTVEYTEQLQRKNCKMKDEALLPLLRKIKKLFRDSTELRPGYLDGHLDKTFGNVVIKDILPSPQRLGYRNKCEFTFGYDQNGQKSLGFRCTNFDKGVVVDPPTDVPTVPNAMKCVVQKIIEFIRTSELPIYDLKTHAGVWRLCTIRYSRRTNDLHVLLCVALVGIEPQLWATEVKRLSIALQALKRDITTDMGDDVDVYVSSNSNIGVELVTGAGYQAYDGASVAPTDFPVHSIFGRGTVKEILSNASFEIAPTAFFQVSGI